MKIPNFVTACYLSHAIHTDYSYSQIREIVVLLVIWYSNKFSEENDVTSNYENRIRTKHNSGNQNI